MHDTPRSLISAHRGGRDEAPENTLAAFERARDLGIPGIECDVRLSADGVPVIIHDDTVDRTTNGTGEVHTLTVEQLARLDARASHHDWPSTPHVPTFAELMGLAEGFDYFEVEIKPDAPERAERIVPLLLAEVDRAGAREKVRFISFDPAIVALCRKLAADMMNSLIVRQTTEKEIQAALDLGCDGISGPVKTLTEPFVATAHEAGLKVTCWTANTDEDVDNMLAWNVDVIITAYPEYIRDRLAARQSAGRVLSPAVQSAGSQTPLPWLQAPCLTSR
jgi:glycerophosphoryl diester phosphodiesterase